jgi:two-component system, response regulator PdtaR
VQKKTILVVEDEPIIAMELQESLESAGYNVPEIIRNADGVMQAVMKHNPDLLIMDIYLKSFIDGIDTAQRVKMIKQVPLIFLTAYPNDAIKKKAMSINPDAYLLKPISNEELHQHVEKVLGKYA